VAGVVGGVECSDGEDRCAFHALCSSLCDAYARVYLCDVPMQIGSAALMAACAGGHLEVAQWLVSSAGSNAVTERNDVCMML
jgi:hypothetical protein